MKRGFILLLIAIAPVKVFSQIGKGSIVVGGQFSLSVSKDKTEYGNNSNDGPSHTYFSIIPDVEYFLAENFSAGIGIGYELHRSKSETNNSETISKNGMFLISPYVKKYFSLGNRAYFYGQGLLSLGFGKNTDEVSSGNTTISSDENHNSFRIGIVPGFRFDISNRVGLEAGIGFIGYSRDVTKSGSGNNEEKDITNSFELSFIPNSLSLGIRYKLK